VLSYCLFGTDHCYRDGIIENCALARRFFPGWALLVHVSERVAPEVSGTLERAGAKVVVMPQRDAYDGLYWRFLPAADPTLSAVVVRDADARLGPRERAAVDEWLASGKSLHVMRDHPGHRRLIPAGLWGCRGGAVPDMAALIERFGHENGFASRTGDADFLERHVYPRLRHDMCLHSAFSYFPGEEPRYIAAARDGLDYLGRPVGRDQQLARRLSGFARRSGEGRVLRPLPEWMSA
jgi:hypothetical protein